MALELDGTVPDGPCGRFASGEIRSNRRRETSMPNRDEDYSATGDSPGGALFDAVGQLRVDFRSACRWNRPKVPQTVDFTRSDVGAEFVCCPGYLLAAVGE